MTEYRLKTFGGLSLYRTSTNELNSALQKSRLAILVVVANAGETGIGRERLAAMFWPESDDDRSRNALNQALFGLRRGTTVPLISGTDILTFNFAACDVDFAQFERAIAAGNIEEAIALYDGPFLQDVRFRSSGSFERWVQEKRDAIDADYSTALRKSFEAAQESGDLDLMLLRSKARAALMPYDTRAAEDLVRTLCRAGEFESAQRHAELYERMIVEVLGVQPDERVGAVIRECVEDTSIGAVSSAVPIPSDNGHSSIQLVSESSQIVPRSGSASSSRMTLNAGIVGAIMLAMAAGLFTWQRRAAAGSETAGETIAIFPFCVKGQQRDPDLSAGMVDLVAASLPGDAGPRPLDSRVTIGMLSREGNPCTINNDRVRQLARKLGATYFVTGNAVVARKTMLISGEVIRTGEASAAARQVIAEGDADSVQTTIRNFTDQIQAMLIVEPDRRMPDILSRSGPALRSYLHGRALWRSGQKIAAINEFVNALDADSTFALAGLALSEAGGWLYAGEYEASTKSLLRISAVRGKLSRRDQALLDAANGAPPRRLSDFEALNGWKNAVDVAPDTPTAWYEYGDRLFHVGASIGLANPFDEAKVAFDKAVALDSSYVLALGHLIEVSMIKRDTAAVRRYAKLYESAGVKADFRPFVEWRLATFFGDAKRLAEIHEHVAEYSTASLHRIAGMAQVENVDLPFGMNVLRVLEGRRDMPMFEFDAAVRLHDRAVNDRNWVLAEEALKKIASIGVNMSYFMDIVSVDALRLTDIVLGGADTVKVGEILTRLERSAVKQGPAPVDAPRYLGENCALGLWYASRDSVRAQVMRERLAQIRPSKEADKFPANAAVCVAAINAELAAAHDAPNAKPMIDKLDSLSAVGIQSYGMGFGNFETARLYAKIGDRRNASRAVRRRRYDWTESVRYLSASRALQQRIERYSEAISRK
jgi:DNA-binding SARP family transcriptional activator/tetratricopeptide (TPR) repeat protein